MSERTKLTRVARESQSRCKIASPFWGIQSHNKKVANSHLAWCNGGTCREIRSVDGSGFSDSWVPPLVILDMLSLLDETWLTGTGHTTGTAAFATASVNDTALLSVSGLPFGSRTSQAVMLSIEAYDTRPAGATGPDIAALERPPTSDLVAVSWRPQRQTVRTALRAEERP